MTPAAKALEALKRISDYLFSLDGKNYTHVDAVQSEMQEISQALQTEWQDISTAPRDGTQYLVTNGECVVMATWPNEEIHVFDVTDHQAFWGYPPTHWMPLPAAPPKEETHD